jgi:hypothetical protein
MTDGDDKLSRRYRELPADEPPAALDAGIRDAAHRAVAPKRGSQRWAVPVSLAAVLVLAVGVTLRMQQEQPGIETSVPLSDVVPQAKKDAAVQSEPPVKIEAESKPVPADKLSKPSANVGALPRQEQKKLQKEKSVVREADESRDSRRDAPTQTPPPPAAAPPPPAPAAPPAGAMQAAPARERQEAARAAAPMARLQAPQAVASDSAGAIATTATDARTRELERIARLRREGKNAEADEALEKFRKDYPDYKIPDATWEQVKPR